MEKTVRVSIVLLGLWVVFVGAVLANWLTVTAHNLGVLSVIVGLVVVLIEVFTVWHPWVRT